MLLDVMSFSGFGDVALIVVIPVAIIAGIWGICSLILYLVNEHKTKKLLQTSDNSKKGKVKDNAT